MQPIKFITRLINKHAHRYVVLSSIWGCIGMIMIPIYHYTNISISSKLLIATIVYIVTSVVTNYIYTMHDLKDLTNANDEIMKENYELATALYEHKLYKDNDIAPIVLAMAMVAQENEDDE